MENIDDTSYGDDAILKSSSTPELIDKSTCSTDVIVKAGNEVTIQANMEYDYWYLQMSNDGSTFNTVKTDTGHAYWYDLYTFTPQSGTYYFKIVNYYDRYGSPSGILKYTVKTSDETQTSISINPTVVVPNGQITITPTVYIKGTNDIVKTGTVEFFYGDDISIGTLDLATQSNFTYSGFSSEDTYSIYAIYKANDNYGSSTSSKHDILIIDSQSNVNYVKVEISDVILPDYAVVNLTANLTGTYRIFFNSTDYVDINIVEDNQKVSVNHTLNKGYYNTTVVPQFSSDYILSQTNAEFNVYSKNELNANLTIREANNLDKDSEVTITADNSYDFNLVYWLDKPDASIKSDKLICYISTQNPTETTSITTGKYTQFISTKISSSGSVTFKLVYNATLEDDSIFIKESNELTVNFQINEVVSNVVQIKDKNTGNKTNVAINSDGNVSFVIQYYIVKPESTMISNQKLEIYVNGVKNKTISYPSYDDWFDALEVSCDESGDVSIQAIFTADGFAMLNVDDINEQSNTLKYDINIGKTEINTISIESKEINYGNKANLSVWGSDGEYQVNVDKTYDVTVVDGVGYVIIDVVGANKTYDVEIVSLADPTLKNTSKLKVNPIKPSLTLDATNKDFVYGNLTTIYVGKNSTANGNINVYDGDNLLNNLENIKLSAGNHIIKAIYTADNNFTQEEVTLLINVSKQINELKLTITNATYPNNVSITLNATLDGEYIIRIGNNNFTILVEDGVGFKSLQLKTGNHTAFISYDESQNYSSNEVSSNFKVEGSNIGLKVTPLNSTIQIGDEVEFNTSCDVVNIENDVIFKSDDGWQTTAKIGEIVKYKPTTAGKHIIEVSYEDNNYNPQIVTVSVVVNKKINNIKVEINNATYPQNISIKVTADVKANYTVDINGTGYTVESGVYKLIKLDAGFYCAKIIYENDTYVANTTNTAFNVFKGLNNVKIIALNTTLPDSVKVNVTATKSGNYTVKFNDLYNVTVNVLNDNAYGTATISLPADSYELTIINYDNKNYDLNLVKTNISVFPQPVEASLEIRDGNNINQNYIAGNLMYPFNFEYNLSRTNEDFISEKITIYCNDFEYYVIDNPDVGGFNNIGGNILLTDIGEYEFKAVWTATTSTQSFNQTSNTIKFNIVSNPSSIFSIRDCNFINNSTITLKGKEYVTVELEYLLERENTNYYLYEKNITLYVNGEAIQSTGSVSDGNYAKISFTYLESDDINVFLTFVGKDYLPTNYNEISNVLTYHIVIGDSISNYLIIETNNVDDSQNATITVKSNVDGNYTLNVGGKDYNITLKNGEGSIVIDQLKADSYIVSVISKDNSTFKNETTLIIQNSSIVIPFLTVEVNKTSYPNNATLKIKTNKPDEYIVNVGGKNYNITINNNEFSFNIDVLPVNIYDVVVKAKNNESFYNTTKLNVSKGINNINILIDSIVYLPNKVNVTIIADVDGSYFVNINSSSLLVEVINGRGNNLTYLDEGVYFANISDSNIDFDNYDVVCNNKTFSVLQKQEVISIKDTISSQNIITVTGDSEYTAQIDYLLIKPDDYFDLESLYIIINNQRSSVTPINYGAYTTFSYVFNRSGIYNVQFNYSYMSNSVGLIIPSYSSNIITYNVTLTPKITESIQINIQNVDYPNNINVVVKSSIDGDYWIYINETRYELSLINGSAYKIISNLSAGHYNASVILKSNETIRNTTSFIINKAYPNLNISSNKTSNMIYGDKLKVLYTISKNANGNISIYDNGNVLTSIVVGNNFDDLILSAGNHSLEIRYSGDENFTSTVSSKISVYIKGLENKVDLNITNTTYPNNVSIKIKTTLNGNYTLTIDNKTLNIIVLNNEYEISLKLDAGQHSAYLNYVDSNPSYESKTVYKVFEVLSNAIGLNIIVNQQKIELGKNIILNITSNVNIDDDLIFILPNSTEINVKVGEIIEYKANSIGKQVFTVKFNGNELYSAESTNITVDVYDSQNILENALTINSPNDGTNPIFTINLENASGILSVVVNDITYSEVLDNGVANVEIFDLEVGNYTAQIIYSGDNNYPQSELTKTFTVNKIQTLLDSAVVIDLKKDNTSPTFAVTLPSNAGGNIIISIDGVDIYNLTLVNGKASVTASKLSEGMHNILFTYSGDAKYTNSTFNTTLNIFTPKIIGNEDMVVLYGSGAKYSFYVFGSDGKALTSHYVNININGVTSQVKTDSKGFVSIDINQIPGVYTVEVSLAEVSVSNQIVINHIISSKNIKIKKSAKNIKIKVSLLKVNGKFLKAKKITLKFKGKTYKAKTNKKGIATVSIKRNVIKKLKAGKKYTYTVSYLKDTLNKKIIVKK